jgi:hypothetical protein
MKAHFFKGFLGIDFQRDVGDSFYDYAEKDKAEVTVDEFGADRVLEFTIVGPV